MRIACIVTSLLASGLSACESNDLGEPCGAADSDVVPNPVDGEEPISEVVRLQRDGTCESFQCLTHAGLQPYCTARCEIDDETIGKVCDSDNDCAGDLTCVEFEDEKRCADDDCPTGFACRAVQEIGPLAEQPYCIRKTGCETNLDCEELGKVECRKLGCLDECLLDGFPCPQEANNRLVCEAFETLPCSCNDGSDNCSDDLLTCQPSGALEPWPVSSVAQRGVCFGVDQYATGSQ